MYLHGVYGTTQLLITILLITDFTVCVVRNLKRTDNFRFSECSWDGNTCAEIKDVNWEPDDIVSDWPPGPYALPMPIDGCPESKWKGWEQGYIDFTWRNPYAVLTRNISISDVVNDNDTTVDLEDITLVQITDIQSLIMGPYSRYRIKLNFCFKLRNDSILDIGEWSNGSYGIYGDISGCPQGFAVEENLIKLPKTSFWVSNGYLPYFQLNKRQQNNELRIRICTRSKEWGAYSETNTFPSDEPFVLLYGKTYCTLNGLNIRKFDPPMRRTVDDYGQKVINTAPPSYDDVVELRANLIAATHHIGQYCPAIHILNCDRFKPENTVIPPPNITEQLPNTLRYDSAAIAPAKEVEIKTTPVVMTQLVPKKFDSITDEGYSKASEEVYSKATNMGIDIDQVNNLKKGQAENQEWHEQRLGTITGTKFSSVIKVTEKKRNCDSMVKDMCGKSSDKLKNVPAVKWGRKHENKARQAYINKVAQSHKDFKLQEQGLMVYKDCHFIRGSPDGIVTCSCHGSILVEIKCPFGARMMTVTEGVAQGKIKFLEKVNGRFQLKENSSDGYFAQVQGLMGIGNIKRCNFVVWTTRDMMVLNVNYNEQFFTDRLVPSCKEFFKVHIIPKLLLKETELPTPSPAVHLTSNTNTNVSDIYIASPPATEHVSTDEYQASKRTRVKSPRKTAKKAVSKSNPSSQLVIPSSTITLKQTTSAQLILAESSVYKCATCKKLLPDDNVAPDNSDASVGCDCPNCGGCDIWMCWPCAKYDQDWADSGDNWYCPECSRECDLVY